MQMLGFLVYMIVASETGAGIADQFLPADAIFPEHLRQAIAQLDDPSFSQREAAEQDLIADGFDAVIPLRDAADSALPEMSVRAFDVLLKLYRGNDERTYEAVEQALRQLMHVDNLAVTARAERIFEGIAEIRQTRGIAKFKRLGGIIRYKDANSDRRGIGGSHIEYVLLD